MAVCMRFVLTFKILDLPTYNISMMVDCTYVVKMRRNITILLNNVSLENILERNV
jgi:hypothetical protein